MCNKVLPYAESRATKSQTESTITTIAKTILNESLFSLHANRGVRGEAVVDPHVDKSTLCYITVVKDLAPKSWENAQSSNSDRRCDAKSYKRAAAPS